MIRMINTPSYLTLTDSGLSITDSSIKFVRLRQPFFRGRLEFAECEEIELPEGVIQSGFIQDEGKLTSILKDISSRHSLQFVNITLPEERAYLFSANIDKVPEDSLRDAVAFIIEENAPVTLANSIFDFNVMGEGSDSTLRVTVSVISMKVLDFYLQVLDHVGLIPASFDLESQAIARAIIPKGNKSVELAIDLGKSKYGFYIIENGIVQFTTTLSHDNSFRSELEKIFGYWEAHSSGRKIEQAFICGDRAYEKELVEELKGLCPVPITLANPWANVWERGGIPSSCEPLDLVSAIGAAIPH